MKLKVVSFFGFLSFFAVLTLVAAQSVEIFRPETWFASQEAVFAAAALITPYIVKIFTALGKDWFHTDGKATIWLSVGVAVAIAGVGGYLSLGVFAGVVGIQGALQAVVLTVVAWLASNGMANYDRQVVASGVRRVSEETVK
jgi:hypothetical protein